MTKYVDNQYSRAPMTPAVKEELLNTRCAQSRKALAAFLSAQPQLSYNQCVEALKAAPKKEESTFEQGEFLVGQMEAKRLLCK
jgi:hypothetical protein